MNSSEESIRLIRKLYCEYFRPSSLFKTIPYLKQILYHLICKIIRLNESIIEQKSRVALWSIGIIYLLALSYWLKPIFNNEPLHSIGKTPGCHFWDFMVEHISYRNKSISFDPVHNYSKNSTANNHPSPYKIVIGETELSSNDFLDLHEIFLKIIFFAVQDRKKGCAPQFLIKIIWVENREGVDIFGEGLYVRWILWLLPARFFY